MAATTATRSTRRADGNGLHHPHHHYLHGRSHSHSYSGHAVAPGTRSQNTASQLQPAAPRMKRPLSPPERGFDAIKRRKHFVVEIPAKPASYHLPSTSNIETTAASSAHAGARATIQAATTRAAAPPQPPAPQRPPVAENHPPNPTTTSTAGSNKAPTRTSITATTTTTTTTHNNAVTNLTKHQEKVVNGLKHELDRLQPNKADTKEQGRKLRSQEATRFKSELSAYFPDYDEVIGNEPKEHHILNIDTPIILTDNRAVLPPSYPIIPPQLPAQASSGASSYIPPQLQSQPPNNYSIRSYGDSLFTDLFDSQRINLDFLKAQHHKGKSAEGDAHDPLPDSIFEAAHKKAERLEKSIRNSEKGRAQHEKDQIIRLLDGLQGPDWLRVMGVSGITEGKKKGFEPARAHFIRGCQAILDKFRAWAAEEKRRKVEKENRERAAAAARAEEEGHEVKDSDEEEQDDDDDAEEEAAEDLGEDLDADMEDDDGSLSAESDGDPPDSTTSDVDARIAKQLRQEVLAAAKNSSTSRARVTRRSVSIRPPTVEPEVHKPFASFFAKPYQRTAALSNNRRRGRKVLAWGHPVPDVVEQEFELPEDLRDEDTLKSAARRKRIYRRGKQ